MGARKPAESRYFPRFHNVVGPFPGRFITKEEAEVTARVLDVSRDGLGILVEKPIRAGDVLDLEVTDDAGKRIAMTIVYCVPDLIHKNSFRVGLRRVGTAAENLVNIFSSRGCLER